MGRKPQISIRYMAIGTLNASPVLSTNQSEAGMFLTSGCFWTPVHLTINHLEIGIPQVLNMEYMFNGADLIMTLANWNTSAVTNMSHRPLGIWDGIISHKHGIHV